ncbi:MAG: glutaminyl-tRNA synthase (glutamine-hydrolyzing) subunit B [Spirochaetes bacterium GWF1_41_5]|nr:MAG: glutaminyl-tRNA synthase (glutamine-hydrolyzing) subunit B [Spirochaetes bacterium GWF1_41_5]HBE01955.1 Asp-tRNA(Asn)/Glu-tRNA(Gln) amidotransferase GatCAB subunit B [Spirochaetia bacterium]
MNLETVIGLEVHVQLNTKSKIFCGCANQFGGEPNTRTCPVCQAHPGALPVFNRAVLDKAIAAGLGLNCQIESFCRFDRKNYFYPDLPKAYQISQFEKPLCRGGFLEIETEENNKTCLKKIGITRVHIEEDAGKLMHSPDGESLVDLNRAGTPLIEIVSEPEIGTPSEAAAWLASLRSILLYLNVSDCNMEEGSLRCDANISLRPRGEIKLGTKVEIKNMNSFKSVKAALEYEISRQQKLLLRNEKIIQETRLFSADEQITRSMRSKEESHDYRYFPDPDLAPLMITEDMLARVKASLPELPDAKKKRFAAGYGLSAYNAGVLTGDPFLAAYFERAVGVYPQEPKKICNWIMVEVLAVLKEQNITLQNFRVKPQQIAALLKLVDSGAISGKIAKTVFSEMAETGRDPETIIKEKNLAVVSDTEEIRNLCLQLAEKFPDQASQFKNGNTKVLGFFMGEIMKATRGQADPKPAAEILKEILAG